MPFTIEVDTKAVVTDSLREQLRGLGRFFWQPWSQAAAWCAANGVNLEEATAWADRSIAMNENFTNLRVKAALLGQRGDEAGAEAAARRSLAIATEAEMNTYGYLLMGQGKVDSALVIFRKNIEGLSQVVEHLRQPGRGVRQEGRQEAGDRELLQGARDDAGSDAEEANSGSAGGTSVAPPERIGGRGQPRSADLV